jgi:IS5 family transposase
MTTSSHTLTGTDFPPSPRTLPAVETVFAAQKHRFRLFVRTIGMARAQTKIGLANLVYNATRFIWLEARPKAA